VRNHRIEVLRHQFAQAGAIARVLARLSNLSSREYRRQQRRREEHGQRLP
jgi:hypothetical protein